MAKNNIRMPQSTAGITNYYSDVKTRYQIEPIHVVAIIVALIIVLLLLHAFGGGILR